MSERYYRLFSLPDNGYAQGAPVVLAAGALLKDNQTGQILAQLKIRSLSQKPIKAATVSLAPLDTLNKPLGDAISYQYLDLQVLRDGDFGSKTPIPLPDPSTRAFSAAVTEVIFADNTLWTVSNDPWEPLGAPVTLEQALGDKELAKQCQIQYGSGFRYQYQAEKDLWQCACGALNHQDEPRCHKCHLERTSLTSLPLAELKASRDKRLALEQQQREEAQAAAAARAQKTKKLALILLPVLLVALVVGAFLGKSQDTEEPSDAGSAVTAPSGGESAAAEDPTSEIESMLHEVAVPLLQPGDLFFYKVDGNTVELVVAGASSRERPFVADMPEFIEYVSGTLTDAFSDIEVEVSDAGEYASPEQAEDMINRFIAEGFMYLEI